MAGRKRQLMTTGYFYRARVRSRIDLYQRGPRIALSGRVISFQPTFVPGLQKRMATGERCLCLVNTKKDAAGGESKRTRGATGRPGLRQMSRRRLPIALPADREPAVPTLPTILAPPITPP